MQLKKIQLILVGLLIGFTLTACGPRNESKLEENKPPTTENTDEETEVTDNEEQETNSEETNEETSTISMKDIFPANDAKLYFKGDGNEFAELNVELTYLGDDYIVKRENNGGAFIQTVFKISEEKIEVIKDHVIDLDEPKPTIEQLEDAEVIVVYLSQPIEEGATFDGWEIIETDAELETAFKDFMNVIVIENIDNEFTNRRYIVPGYGEVKRENIMEMEEEDSDFIVTSILQSMEEL